MQINFNIDWVKLGIGFVIQTVFLALALWAMLKQQKLTCKFPGLLGSVLLACVLVQIPYVGAVISFVVLLLCITKAIGARTFTDAIVAVGVAFAPFVVFNFVVLSLLLGILRPMVKVRARVTEPAAVVHAVVQTNQLAATNLPAAAAPAVEAPATATTIAAVPAPQTLGTNPAAPAPTTPVAAVPVRPPEPVFDTNSLISARMAGDIMKHFFVKGFSQGATISIAMISNGTRNFDVSAGDIFQLETSDGRYAAVKCESVAEGEVVISVGGVKVTLLRR
jgi:hypothetical protein